MVLAVWRVVLSWKFVAGSSLERWWAQVVQDVPKSTEIWRPGAAFWSTLGLCGRCLGGPWRPWGRFWLQPGVCRLCFSQFCGKSLICVFRLHSRTESILWQVPAPSWSHLGRKVEPDRSRMAPKWQIRGIGTVKFGRSARSCCKGYGNCRERPHRSPDLSHGGGQSLSKRQDIWLDLLYIYIYIYCILWNTNST